MKRILIGLSAVVLMASCRKEPVNNLTDEESRIYITNRDSSVNISALKTFSISDSIAVIVNNKLQQKSLDAWDASLIAAVSSAMQQRGFTRVNRDQSPDIGITINAISNTYTGVISYNDYWDFYGGYWDPYYWGYPGYGYYPSYVGIYQSAENALSIDMLNLKGAGNNQIKPLWSGLIRGSGIFEGASVQQMVQTLFDQSPYLQTNK